MLKEPKIRSRAGAKKRKPLFVAKAEQAANDILTAFQNPNSLPSPLAEVFIRRKDQVPCRSWSWRNQLIVALHGYRDARGFRQWEAVGRRVKKGERAFRILSPLTKKVVDKETEEERWPVIGFKGTPVFGLGQTEGDPLPKGDPELDAWVKSLPLLEVARAWGVEVRAVEGHRRGPRGEFRFGLDGEGQMIAVAVKNLSVWTHELVHAADFRNGKLEKGGQHWASETVAQLGGAVLLRLLGHERDADLGGCWDYISVYAERNGIEALDACGFVLDRTCEAVALILDTAEGIKGHDRIGPSSSDADHVKAAQDGLVLVEM